jgi:hypothetical protein
VKNVKVVQDLENKNVLTVAAKVKKNATNVTEMVAPNVEIVMVMVK